MESLLEEIEEDPVTSFLYFSILFSSSQILSPFPFLQYEFKGKGGSGKIGKEFNRKVWPSASLT